MTAIYFLESRTIRKGVISNRRSYHCSAILNIYNIILSVDVMEHIEEDVLVFQNFYKSLKNNGVLLISTPSDKGGSDVHNDHGGVIYR